MKVIHLINSLGRGGAENQLVLLTAEARRWKFEQVIVTLYGAKEPIAVGDDVRVRTPRPARRGLIGACMGAIAEARGSVTSILVAWMYHSWIVAIAAWIICQRRHKLLLYCRHGDPDHLRAWTRFVAWTGLLLATRLRLLIVFNSHAAYDAHRKWFPRVRGVVIPNGVDVLALADCRTVGARRCFGFFGRDHSDKGSDLLAGMVADVLKACPGWRFRVAGPGMKRREAEVLGAAVAVGVDPGRIHVSDSVMEKTEFFREIGILLLPSRTESFPNVVVEAMAASVLVAANPVGDVPLILGDLVPVASSSVCVSQIAIGMANWPSDERRVVGNALAQIARDRYSTENISAEHWRLWTNHGGLYL